MNEKILFEKSDAKSDLIYKHTHKDMKGYCGATKTIVYGSNGGSVLGCPSGMPEDQYAEHYIYALLKEFQSYQEPLLKQLSKPFKCDTYLDQTAQWRDSLESMRLLLRNDEAIQSFRDHGVVFLNELDGIYCRISAFNHRCKDGVLRESYSGWEQGQCQRSVWATVCEQLEQKVAEQKKVLSRFTQANTSK